MCGRKLEWDDGMESIKPSSQSTSEIVAFHKIKRKFLGLRDMEKEDLNEILICEFMGQDFELLAVWEFCLFENIPT